MRGPKGLAGVVWLGLCGGVVGMVGAFVVMMVLEMIVRGGYGLEKRGTNDRCHICSEYSTLRHLLEELGYKTCSCLREVSSTCHLSRLQSETKQILSHSTRQFQYVSESISSQSRSSQSGRQVLLVFPQFLETRSQEPEEVINIHPRNTREVRARPVLDSLWCRQ